MADDTDKESKTEQPSGKRLSQARDQGQAVISQEINSLAALSAALAAVVFLVPTLMDKVAKLNASILENLYAIDVSATGVQYLFAVLSEDVILFLAPIFGLFLVTGIAVNIAQVGWKVTPVKLVPKLNAFSPINGLKRILGPRALVEFAKGLVKFGTVSCVGAFLLVPAFSGFELFPGIEPIFLLERIKEIAIRLGGGTIAVMVVVAVLDYLYQRHSHYKKLMMTKQEVKDEHKQTEGDPKIKQRLAKIRMERAQQRMIQAMPRADVLITNPTHYAVALEYKMETMQAPVLIAKGVDNMALRLREAADEHDVPIVENPPLARALYAAVELDEEIPAEHYHAVAEVIGYVYRLKGRVQQAGAGASVPPG